MPEDLNQELAGVVCLHCGMKTPLPRTAKLAGARNSIMSRGPKLAIVRCRKCGKEAPYLSRDIVVFNEVLATDFYAA